MKLIVFDLYNTLIQIDKRCYFHRELYKRSEFLNRKYSAKAFQRLLMTKTTADILKESPEDVRKLYHALEHRLDEELASIKVIGQSTEAIKQLHQNYQLGIISNASTPYKRPFYDLGLSQYFKYTIFSCDIGFQKPEPEIFEEMERLSGYKGNEILMIGDHLKCDYEGSRIAGWKGLRIMHSKPKSRKFDTSSLDNIANHPFLNY